MSRQKPRIINTGNYNSDEFEQGEKVRFSIPYFWIFLLIFICIIALMVWKPAIWFAVIPVLRYMFQDWKKENKKIEEGDYK